MNRISNPNSDQIITLLDDQLANQAEELLTMLNHRLVGGKNYTDTAIRARWQNLRGACGVYAYLTSQQDNTGPVMPHMISYSTSSLKYIMQHVTDDMVQLSRS